MKKQICDVNPVNVSVHMCGREKDKYWREILIISSLCEGVYYLYIRVQRWSGVTDPFPPPQLPVGPPSCRNPLLLARCGWAGWWVVLTCQIPIETKLLIHTVSFKMYYFLHLFNCTSFTNQDTCHQYKRTQRRIHVCRCLPVCDSGLWLGSMTGCSGCW